MMTKYKKHHRVIATLFLLIFFPTLIPNNLFASNNGPSSLEAGSFEPFDATDMVNLVTGDFTYVLPLLNVPSPEGGYPLALFNHAGIAMDQESSWVGLGWNLNAGAINRNTNGYPDDIILGNDNLFVYDQGGELSYYNVGFGANLYGINVGVGAYWGSNKTFGGSVSLGTGGYSVSVTTGTLGTSVGLGHTGSVEKLVSNLATGVTFQSLKNQGGSIGAQGTGLSSSSASFSQSNYDIEVSSDSFSIGYGGFYFYNGNTTVKYGLFDEQIQTYSGILYPNSASNQKHDVNKLVIYNDGVTNINDIGDSGKEYLSDNVLLPNYDRYKVQAQGLSGSISPTFIEETKLNHEDILSSELATVMVGAGSWSFFPQNIAYAKKFIKDNTIKLNNKIFFEFENTNSSFLRVDRSNIVRDLVGEASDSNQLASDEAWRAHKYAKTNKSAKFNEFNTIDNIPLKYNNRKRVGKFVEVFTNQQILEGISSTGGSFIEAKNLNRNQPQIYRAESIGAYRITDVDGKVYHYSLPVINFEMWYKNFSDSNDEYSKFMERELNVPYATDWLLTAVTGPDYVDANGNNKVDSADFGYWVEFDYGKWSDGYIWNGSSGKYDIVKGRISSEDRYEYYRGRKQIYYLDAVRTRTHTAYFVKSLRQDAQADPFARYNTQSVNGVGFNKNANPKEITSNRLSYFDVVPVISNYNFPSTYDGRKVGSVNGYKLTSRYADFPFHYSLKLDKIILVKNDKLLISKSGGSSLLTNKKAFLYENRAFKVTSCMVQVSGGSISYAATANLNGTYLSDLNANLKEIGIHQSENVIDINDIANLNITENAEKIINFEFDSNYSLMPNSFHSSAPNKGKLTLKAVNFLGHKGVSSIPKYQFKYNKAATTFDINDEDGWGYHKIEPAAWSLNEVITPTGSKMNIQYESDDYNAIAAKTSLVISNKGKGGGVRVKEITVSDGVNIINKTKYYYNQIGYNKDIFDFNYKSSGATSYVPSKEFMILPYASELPPPVVMYSNVSVEESNGFDELLLRTDYNFETLRDYQNSSNSVYNVGDYLVVEKLQDDKFTNLLSENLRFTKYNIKNKVSNLGRLISINKFNSKNQSLYSLKNGYTISKDAQDELGTKQESFLSNYIVVPADERGVNSVSKIWYPSQLQQTSITKEGYTNTKYFDKYDFLTGEVIESHSVSSDGKSIKTKVIPAYIKYTEMGSKVDNPNYKNMLSQTAAHYSYILDKGTNTWKETGVGITTWSNIWSYIDMAGSTVSVPATAPAKDKIWRKHKSYVWNGVKYANGIFTNYDSTTGSKDDKFDWTVGVGLQPAQWRQTSEITLYDHFSSPLEMKDINQNLASTKMGDNDTKVIATGNAGYGEMFFAGAENTTSIAGVTWLEQGVKMVSGLRNSTYFHTGKQSVQVYPGSQFGVVMKSEEHRAGKYRVSVWVEKANAANAVITVNDTLVPFKESYTSGNWVFKSANVDVPSSECTIYVTSNKYSIYLDDLMIRPLASSMNGYVYNQWDELTYIIGNNGLATRFEYDNAGRLIKTYSEVIDDAANGIKGGFKLTKSNTYNNKYLQ